MEIRLDTTQKAQTPFSTVKPSQLINQSLYESRIVSGKDSKPVELFWKAWGYVKTAAFVVYDYILWVVRCFPSIPSKLEAVELMIDNPKEKAKDVLKDPVPHLANIFQAALMDPEALDQLRKEDGYGEFLRELKAGGGIPAKIFAGIKRGPKIALEALANPFGPKDNSALFKSLLDILKENVSILGDALLYACERVKNTVGDTDNDKLNALRGVIEKYLPTVGQIAKENPKAFQGFVDELYKLNQIDETLVPKIKKHFPTKAQPSAEDIKNLNLCLEKKGLALSQVGDQDLARSELAADNSVNLGMAFYQGLLQAANPEAIEKAANLIKGEHPLFAGLGIALKELADDSRNLQHAANNLPRAIELLKAIKNDYDNPPAAKKEEKK